MHVLALEDLDHTQLGLVGGKAAHLGELTRIEGILVPPGYCVTTRVFERMLTDAPSLAEPLDRLSRLRPDDRDGIASRSAELRRAIEALPIPEALAAEITEPLAQLGEATSYAVRSSATAEDLPAASFAGQQDTYLNIVGAAAILEHVSRCWGSLFTERAVTYRLRNGFDHRKVQMAVVVQRMVDAQASGVMFTAHPITGHRKVVALEAVPGLGEALVSGQVNADTYEIREGEHVSRTTVHRGPPVLTNAQAARLARLGRRIEAHFGRPQDIEWCLANDELHFVQSRPITTLFPIPAADARNRETNRVYLSVGHQQMMTDAMKPLGLSVFQLTALAPMHEAGGRLFVDVTPHIASPARRGPFFELLEKSDPSIREALQSIVDRGDFLPSVPDDTAAKPPVVARPAPLATDPAIVDELKAHTRASLEALEREIGTKSGPALFDFILADLPELKRVLADPRGHQVFMTAMEASWWLDANLQTWLGEKGAADTLTKSAPGNVTSEMGLALLDVADVIRPCPAVVARLRETTHDHFLEALPELDGGREACDAMRAFLDRYGMRCAGEIDITRPRWSERPSTLLPIILGHVESSAPGEGKRRFEAGRAEAAKKEAEVLARLRALPDGEAKAEQTRQMIDRVRTFIGYREYPKYGLVCRYFIYKQALVAEAKRLVRTNVVRDEEDVFFLTFQELHEVARTGRADQSLIRQRKETFQSNQALRPPRVLTSDGETVASAHRRTDVPAGALAGLPVSTGVVDGRARVIAVMADARLEAGDILVATATDPGWTPLFVAIAGLVTEVGGAMTHGAVIAREYGLPAVVGVENATRLIRDGQRIRVHGTNGYVELLP